MSNRRKDTLGERHDWNFADSSVNTISADQSVRSSECSCNTNDEDGRHQRWSVILAYYNV